MGTGDEVETPRDPLWRRVARVYDWQLALESHALRAALDLAAPTADEELLDVGTGTGGVLRELAHRPNPPRRAVGVDSSPEMLAAAPPLPGDWTLERADARDLPFADGRFLVVVSTYLLHLLEREDRTRALAEMARVLAPGGRLVTVTPALPRARPGRWLVRPVAAAAERASGFLAGLRTLDPSAEIDAHVPVRRIRWTNAGYPSISVLARAPEITHSDRGDGPR